MVLLMLTGGECERVLSAAIIEQYLESSCTHPLI